MAITHCIFVGLQYLKGRKCNFPDNGDLFLCCIKTNDAGREFGMAQFKCKPSLNIQQDFPNHFMSICFETRKRHQSKFSASTSLTETRIIHDSYPSDSYFYDLRVQSSLSETCGGWQFGLTLPKSRTKLKLLQSDLENLSLSLITCCDWTLANRKFFHASEIYF